MDTEFKFLTNVLTNPKWKFEHHPEAHFSVNNCRDAAKARNIKLFEELKSIVLNVNDKFYVFHFLGDEILLSRIIEKHFKKVRRTKPKKFRFATFKELIINFGISKGQVTPLNEKIWNTYQYLSPSLLQSQIVYTNDGTLNGYIQFDSRMLLETLKNNIQDDMKLSFTKKSTLKMKSDAHHALSGLVKTIYTHNDLEDNIRKYLDKAQNNGFKGGSNKGGDNKRDSKYNFIRIIDSFFSDTFSSRNLIDAIRKSKENGQDYVIQIILLNPFTESADEREKSLHDDGRIERLNRGLYKIKMAISGFVDSPDDEFDNNFKSASYIFKQLNQIEKIKEEEGYENSLKIQFSNVCRFPIYIIAQYVFKGEFLDFISSKKTPWHLYVDDKNEDEDIYDQYRLHFESLWKKSKQLQTKDFLQKFSRKNIFISRGGDSEFIALKVKSIINEEGYNPILFDDVKSRIDAQTVPNILNSMFKMCGSAIIILTKEDLMEDGSERVRQNVVHELGYSQAAYGPLVLLLAEKDIELPTNLSGYLISHIEIDENKNVTLNQQEIIRFLGRVKRKLHL